MEIKRKITPKKNKVARSVDHWDGAYEGKGFQPIIAVDRKADPISEGANHQSSGSIIQPKLEINQPGDKFEREADAVADRVAHGGSQSNTIQRKCADCEGEEDKLQRKEGSGEEEEIMTKSEGGSTTVNNSFETNLQSSKGGGDPMADNVRSAMEEGIGADFSGVQIHTNSNADQLNRSINAKAFTHGSDIYFKKGAYDPGSSEGKHLLAHELTHTVQQGASGLKIQRYGTGEHTQFGEVDSMIEGDHTPYTVLAGEGLIRIAAKHNVDVDELRELNKDKLREFDIEGRRVIGFLEGEVIQIPGKNKRVNDSVSGSGQKSIIIKGIVFTYGELIACGDFFANPDAIFDASRSQLRTLKGLLVREARSSGSVTTEEWEAVTNGEYLQLAQANDSHFAPQNALLTPLSTEGATSENHKVVWERYHREALDHAAAGDRDRALATNAFADHFLTDAFASGHLVNKQDIMVMARDSIVGNEDDIFEAIATQAWTDPDLVALVSAHESTKWHKANIDRVSRFASLLQGIYEDETVGRPLIMNAYAKVTHDDLNANMVEVVNDVGDTWTLSGDDSLNPESLAIGKKAVAQSQVNVLNMLSSPSTPDYTAMYEAVWKYVPRPTEAGEQYVQERVSATADAQQTESINAMAALLQAEIGTIIQGLVDQGHLQLHGE